MIEMIACNAYGEAFWSDVNFSRIVTFIISLLGSAGRLAKWRNANRAGFSQWVTISLNADMNLIGISGFPTMNTLKTFWRIWISSGSVKFEITIVGVKRPRSVWKRTLKTSGALIFLLSTTIIAANGFDNCYEYSDLESLDSIPEHIVEHYDLRQMLEDQAEWDNENE